MVVCTMQLGEARLAEGGWVGDSEAGLLDEDPHEYAGNGQLTLQRREGEARCSGNVRASALLFQLRKQLFSHAPVPYHLSQVGIEACGSAK